MSNDNDRVKWSYFRLRIGITASALFVAGLAIWLRFTFPNISFNIAELGLLLLAVVPWLAPIIKSIEVPGIGKVEFKEIKEELADLRGKQELTEETAKNAKETAETAKSAAILGIGKKAESAVEEPLADEALSDEGDLPVNDPEDPQNGRWGGQEEDKGRRISAQIERITGNDRLRRIIIKVESINPEQNPLSGSVLFHLHPTFANSDPTVSVVNGQATLILVAWGVFTVGAEADGGKTRLELNLKKYDDGSDFFNR
jgi:hypothetical protein